MSHDQSFRRKIIYIGTIVLLLFPLFWIGQPKTLSSPGGILARLRHDNNLSQAQLGDIDPASESMKLATLGLRGVAANILWEKAHVYKKKEDWVNLSATLNQITKLQPNFITVWEFQAHNLSYNISAEFDDYRHRYHWVKKGISFLADGIHFNRDNPRLLHNAGWITGQKMGRADEHVQFREIYRGDTDFHDELALEIPVADATGYDGNPDTWLTSRLWYLRAQRSDVPLKGKSPLIFYADAPMSLVNYSSTIEEEGILGEAARIAWRDAKKAWAEYGQRPIPTSWGHNVRLGGYNAINDEIEQLGVDLDELAPGVKDQLYQERFDQLTDVQRAALDLTEQELTEENYKDHFAARDAVKVTHEEIAEGAPRQNRDKAMALVTRLLDAEMMSHRTAHYRGIINYEYWETRCAAEQTQTAINARKFIYDARQSQQQAALEDARDLYEKGWVEWRKIFDEYPRLMDDVAADDLFKSVRRYDRLLQQLDEEIPADFPLVDFVQIRRGSDEEAEALYKKLSQAVDSPVDAQEEMPAESTGDDEQPAEPTEEAPAATEEPAASPEGSGEPAADPAPSDTESPGAPEGSDPPSPEPPAAESSSPAADSGENS